MLQVFFPSTSLASDVVKVLLGFLSPILIALLARGYKAFRLRNVHRFWRPFGSKKITVVLTEYTVQGNDLESQIAKKAGGGHLVSRGSALALSLLREYLATHVTDESNLTVIGDKSGAPGDRHIVVLGSPAINHVAQSVFEDLNRRYIIPIDIMLDQTHGDIHFISKVDPKIDFHPSIEDDGHGVDYALIIRAEVLGEGFRQIMVIAGAYMFGTQAAAMAVTNKEVMDKVAKLCHNAKNLMFLVRVAVTANTPYNIRVIEDSVKALEVVRPSVVSVVAEQRDHR